MNTFIENNRKLLVIYYWISRSGGWIFLLIASLAVGGHSLALISRIGNIEEFERYYYHDVPWGMLTNALPTGILALGISQLIKYLLYFNNNRPGWILRNAGKLVYIYTTLLIGFYCWYCIRDLVLSLSNEPHYFPARVILYAIFMVVKLFVLVGAAEILRRAIPVIEEHRTLV